MSRTIVSDQPKTTLRPIGTDLAFIWMAIYGAARSVCHRRNVKDFGLPFPVKRVISIDPQTRPKGLIRIYSRPIRAPWLVWITARPSCADHPIVRQSCANAISARLLRELRFVEEIEEVHAELGCHPLRDFKVLAN